jgi:hypothetical protein
MNTTHTPEPWRVYAWRNGSTFAIEYIQPSGISAFICQVNGSNGQSEANASRIVACVNACAGIHDPQELIIGADFALKENRELKAQRDTLLEAIKSHLDLYNAGLLTNPQKLEEHTLKLAEIYTNIINS